MDPARPLFDSADDADSLRKGDAKFIQVIHTSNVGMYYRFGDADYWPNGGFAMQPGCKADIGKKFNIRINSLIRTIFFRFMCT